MAPMQQVFRVTGGRRLEGEIGVAAVEGPDPVGAEQALGRLEQLLPRPAGAGRDLPVVPLPA